MYDYVFKNDKHIIHVLYSAQKCWKMPNSIEQHRTCVKQLTCEACIHVINTYYCMTMYLKIRNISYRPHTEHKSTEQHRTASNMCQATDLWSMYTCNKYILMYDSAFKNDKYIYMRYTEHKHAEQCRTASNSIEHVSSNWPLKHVYM
jgi:hypothetical protein